MPSYRNKCPRLRVISCLVPVTQLDQLYLSYKTGLLEVRVLLNVVSRYHDGVHKTRNIFIRMLPAGKECACAVQSSKRKVYDQWYLYRMSLTLLLYAYTFVRVCQAANRVSYTRQNNLIIIALKKSGFQHYLSARVYTCVHLCTHFDVSI